MATGMGHVAGEFRIGRVLGRAGGIWQRSLVPFTVVCLVATLPNYFPRLMAGNHVMTAKQTLAYLPLLLVTIITTPLSHAIITVAAFQDMRGERLRIGAAVDRAFARFLPLVSTTICTTLAFLGGLMLLVVPGLIVATMLSVAIPACVMERLGPIASLQRSAALTKGRRWSVFGIFIVLGVLSSLVGGVANPLQRAFGIVGVVVVYIGGGLLGAYGGSVYATMFNELRVEKEGVGTERIASVFD